MKIKVVLNVNATELVIITALSITAFYFLFITIIVD